MAGGQAQNIDVMKDYSIKFSCPCALSFSELLQKI
jgi:hypothetical protein